MEVKDSLTLMFMFGMFILALLSFPISKRSRPPLSHGKLWRSNSALSIMLIALEGPCIVIDRR